MIFDYIVTLRRDSERATDLLSLLLCLISVFCFSYTAARGLLSEDPGAGPYKLLAVFAAILTACVVFYFVTRKRKLQMRFKWPLLLAGLAWLAMPILPWLGGVFFILAFLEHQSKRPLEICFDKNQIVINSLIRRKYVWTDLSNVVLRDGLLTLDFVNNRLLQKEVVEEEDDDAEEDEFNDWCRERLAEAMARA